MVIIPKKDTYCHQCAWSTFVTREGVQGFPRCPIGYVCKLNPLRPVFMGAIGLHTDRKKNIEEKRNED